ncbi:MAG: helix-turn-helix domain-containing protein [Reichenbachiella sp.]|uniref:helix-turn-helix domain-containing protein n=1 Tax=Reichenbachiella sp. TaxID=2184521 RepID=UPI0032999774
MSKFNFIQIPLPVLYHKELKDFDKILFGQILSLTKDKGYCFASNSKLAQVLSKSESTITKSVGRLTRSGFIKPKYQKSNYRRIYVIEESLTGFDHKDVFKNDIELKDELWSNITRAQVENDQSLKSDITRAMVENDQYNREYKRENNKQKKDNKMNTVYDSVDISFNSKSIEKGDSVIPLYLEDFRSFEESIKRGIDTFFETREIHLYSESEIFSCIHENLDIEKIDLNVKDSLENEINNILESCSAGGRLRRQTYVDDILSSLEKSYESHMKKIHGVVLNTLSKIN